MFINYIKKRKLMKLLDKLAIYNDKGIDWSKHDESQIQKERLKLTKLINKQLNKLGNDNFPTEFLSALENGELEKDGTGKYFDIAKSIKI